jgi:hypothetical protein
MGKCQLCTASLNIKSCILINVELPVDIVKRSRSVRSPPCCRTTRYPGERKVLNKYIPPGNHDLLDLLCTNTCSNVIDFDYTKIPKGIKKKDGLYTVNMMMPMTVQCTTCGEYLYAGKKFNSKAERTGEDYLGIKILRFYMKCTNCRSQFTIKTDPKAADYQSEWGCTRNFEKWKDDNTLREEAKAAQAKDEEGDAMKALENRTQQSKSEMAILENLDEIRSLNARNSRLTIDEILEAKLVESTGAVADAEDSAAVRNAFHAARREALEQQRQQLSQYVSTPAKRALGDDGDKDNSDDDHAGGGGGGGGDGGGGDGGDDDDEDELAAFDKMVQNRKRQRVNTEPTNATTTTTTTMATTTTITNQSHVNANVPVVAAMVPLKSKAKAGNVFECTIRSCEHVYRWCFVNVGWLRR